MKREKKIRQRTPLYMFPQKNVSGKEGSIIVALKELKLRWEK